MSRFYYLLCITIVLAFSHGSLRAQPGLLDTTTLLPALEVQSNRLNAFKAGYTVRTYDSIRRMASHTTTLADLLGSDGWIYVKRYGTGGLGSISLRGTSAVHSAVVWNGFNLQSPMNGGSDLNLFPVSSADELQVQSGGSCALFGSGAIGGSIHLNSHPDFGSGFSGSISTSAGSYGNYGTQVFAGAGTKRSYTSVKAFFHYGKNNFHYTNEEGQIARMKHANVLQYGLIGGQQLQIGKTQLLDFHIWFQENERAIPAALYTLGAEDQHDRTLRGSAGWKTLHRVWNLALRTMISSEKQHYLDSLPFIDARNNFINSITEAEFNVTPGKGHHLNVGINNTLEQVRSNNYAGKVARNRVALFAAHSMQSRNGKLKTSLSVREEYSGKELLSPVFSVGLDYLPTKMVGLKFALARVYRIPTLNDLYWNPGGDPELKPEQGWTFEAGLTHDFRLSRHLKFYKSLTVFSNHINDWIVWLPAGAYWTPMNIQTVWSRGLESRLQFTWQSPQWYAALGAEYSSTHASNMQARFAGDASVGKQLIYTPTYRASAHLHLSWKGFLLAYNYQFTDRRYLSSDNIDYLPSFQIHDVQISKQFKLQQTGLRLSFGVANLFDYRYLVIAGTPMPGRTYTGSLQFQFQKPLKKSLR